MERKKYKVKQKGIFIRILLLNVLILCSACSRKTPDIKEQYTEEYVLDLEETCDDALAKELKSKRVINDEGKEMQEISLPGGDIGKLLFYIEYGAEVSEMNRVDLYKMDESGKETLLAEGESGTLFMTLENKEWMIFANGEGVYRKSLISGEKQLLFLWYLHGISFPQIYDMQIDENGKVHIWLNREDEVVHIRLSEPPMAGAMPEAEETFAEEPIQITFLGNPYNNYREVIVSFQKKYPQYSVVQVSYPEEERLLTELNSGKGPVLLDTYSIGFGKHADLWECLDDEMEASQLNDMLLDNVLECGRIDGKLYGMINGWTVHTYGTMHEVTDWNYEEYIQYLKEHPEIDTLFSEQNPVWFIKKYFFMDVMDCPFFDWEAKKVMIDTPEFQELLELAKELAVDVPNAHSLYSWEDINLVKQGLRLGADIYFSHPTDLRWEMDIYDEKLNIVGYPGGNGSKHYIMPNGPLVIRKNASEEEKKVAFLFLEELLSSEFQRELSEIDGSNISVRKDILEEQLLKIPDNITMNVEGVDIEGDIELEKLQESFWLLYEKLMPLPETSEEVYDILDEELELYFYGDKDLQEVTQILQKRLQLWMDENY